MKEKSFSSVKKETSDIEALMEQAANKGAMRLEVDGISDAARKYFIDNGFEVKLILRPENPEPKISGKQSWVILWEK